MATTMTLDRLTKAGATDAPEDAPKSMTLEQLMAAGAVDAPEDAPKSMTLEQLTAAGAVDAPESKAPAPSAAETFSRGVSSYVPFGKQAEAAFNTLPIVGTGKSYSENMADIKARTEAGETAHPDAANLGKGTGLGLSMVAPGGIPVQSALGAAGAAGDANAEGKGIVDTLGAAGRGAALQGLAGPIAGKVPRIVQGVAKVAAPVVGTGLKVLEHPIVKAASTVAAVIGGAATHGVMGAAHALEGAGAAHVGVHAIRPLHALLERAASEGWTNSKLAGEIAKVGGKAVQAAGTEAAHAP